MIVLAEQSPTGMVLKSWNRNLSGCIFEGLAERIEQIPPGIRFSMHDFLKCEVYQMGFALGYVSVPEYRVYSHPKLKFAYHEFDMVWFLNGKPVFAFEMQVIYDADGLEYALQYIGSCDCIHLMAKKLNGNRIKFSLRSRLNPSLDAEIYAQRQV